MSKFAVGLTLVIVLGIVLCVSGCGAQRPKPENEEAPGNPGSAAQIQRFDFSQWFSHEPVTVKPVAPQYDLPLDAAQIADFEPVVSSLELSPEATGRLLNLGFVVTDLAHSRKCEDIADAYGAIRDSGVPVIVTSGSLLHVFHVLFDDLLRTIESERLYDELWSLSLELHNSSLETYHGSDGDLAEAARRNAIFFAVGLSLLTHKEEEPGRSPLPRGFRETESEGYQFEVPGELAEEVEQEIELISKHGGFTPSPLFIYVEDYSQYVPRGHYTYSEKLKKYFKAMMWYGRMTMLLKGSGTVDTDGSGRTRDGLISQHDARIQTLEALMIASAMDSDEVLFTRWETMYRVTSFFVGFSDDLGPYEYIEAMNDIFGSEPELATFTDEHHGELKARLAEYHSPRIYGGTGNPVIFPPFTPEQADEILDVTRGFRLMGQRYVPDSHILSNLVAPYTGEFTGGEIPFTGSSIQGVGIYRVFPRGLDVVAVLGSKRARDILDETGDADYEKYNQAFADIKQEIDAIQGPEWNQNLYWNWIWMLKAYVGESPTGYPVFMRSDAWRDRVITQALASWSELRHDTILYVKQSYTMALGSINLPPEEPVGPPPGYVEPVIETYTRLSSLTRMMREGLTAMGVIGSQGVRDLTGLENALARLVSISTLELEGHPLGEEDLNYIHDFGGTLDNLLGGLEKKSRKTTLVADVHTDGNSSMVLEEAVGYVDLLVAAWKSADGNIYIGGGPELSYYEFKQPMSNRLTDEAWRELLKTDRPAAPPWTSPHTTP